VKAAAASPALELDLLNHVYRRGGTKVPGVSEMMAALNIVDASRFTDFGRDRGKAIHEALELHMTGPGVAWSSVDDRIKGYVTAGVNFLNDAGVKIGPGTHIERPIWNPLLNYCGTPDLVAECFGQPSIPDFKSGAIGEAGIATALYEMAARSAYPLPNSAMRRRFAVQLFPDGRYKLHPLGDGFDYSYAQSIVSLYHRFIGPRVAKEARNGNPPDPNG